MEFIFKKMEIIIKENGKMIILMDKEFLFGIMVIHIEGNGRIIKDMVMVLLIKIMENLTKEIFFMIKKKVKEEKFFKMEMFMKENGKMIFSNGIVYEGLWENDK